MNQHPFSALGGFEKMAYAKKPTSQQSAAPPASGLGNTFKSLTNGAMTAARSVIGSLSPLGAAYGAQKSFGQGTGVHADQPSIDSTQAPKPSQPSPNQTQPIISQPAQPVTFDLAPKVPTDMNKTAFAMLEKTAGVAFPTLDSVPAVSQGAVKGVTQGAQETGSQLGKELKEGLNQWGRGLASVPSELAKGNVAGSDAILMGSGYVPASQNPEPVAQPAAAEPQPKAEVAKSQPKPAQKPKPQAAPPKAVPVAQPVVPQKKRIGPVTGKGLGTHMTPGMPRAPFTGMKKSIRKHAFAELGNDDQIDKSAAFGRLLQKGFGRLASFFGSKAQPLREAYIDRHAPNIAKFMERNAAKSQRDAEQAMGMAMTGPRKGRAMRANQAYDEAIAAGRANAERGLSGFNRKADAAAGMVGRAQDITGGLSNRLNNSTGLRRAVDTAGVLGTGGALYGINRMGYNSGREAGVGQGFDEGVASGIDAARANSAPQAGYFGNLWGALRGDQVGGVNAANAYGAIDRDAAIQRILNS